MQDVEDVLENVLETAEVAVEIIVKEIVQALVLLHVPLLVIPHAKVNVMDQQHIQQ